MISTLFSIRTVLYPSPRNHRPLAQCQILDPKNFRIDFKCNNSDLSKLFPTKGGMESLSNQIFFNIDPRRHRGDCLFQCILHNVTVCLCCRW